MAWIELHQAVRDHRKIVELAGMLDMPEPHVVGHLAFLWLWGLDNAPDGVLPESNRVIAKAAQWTGDPDTFVSAMVKCGLLDNNSVDREIHGWSEYAGKLIERRKANAARMKKERAMHVQRTCDARAPKVQSDSTVPNRTVPIPTPITTREVDAATPPKPKRKSRLSADWTPSESLIAYARQQGMTDAEIRRQAELFRDHWLANGETKDSWDATWRNWIRRAPQFERAPSLRVVNGPAPKQFSDEDMANGRFTDQF